MGEYVYHNGKKLRKGYTTGTCATAASVAALTMLLQQEPIEDICVETASGIRLTMAVENYEIYPDHAIAAIQKDGGDDADATHGMLIYAKVSLIDEEQIIIDGGKGIGRVTQKGLSTPVGEAAINPVPRKMIAQSLESLLPKDKGAKVIIFAPEGEERSKQTFNSRLGITGGISILGTTGIVTPMSEEGWKSSISIELEMKYLQGYRKIILTPGNYGEKFVQETMGISEKWIVNMSNFVGYVLKEVQRIGFEEILLVGHIGKFVKLAGGIFSTHSKDADARNEILMANLGLMGASQDILQQVNECSTTEAAGDIIEAKGYNGVYPILVEKIQKRCWQLLKYKQQNVHIEVVLFSSQRGLLASTKPLEELKEKYK